MLNNLYIILCETSHPGNIGSAARAMKNMGLSHLRLVSPKHFPDPKADELASQAKDLLEKAEVFSSLEAAISDCHWVYGTSARTRVHPWPQATLKEAVPQILSASLTQKIAIIFGPERTGLPNEALARSDYHLTIPTHPEYPSLNLAQAVQLVCYELYQASLSELPTDEMPEKATAEEVAGLVGHCKSVANALGFMDPQQPKKLMPRLQRLIAKSQLEKEEINILRGFLRLIQS
jgi:TrmH family RNA methyltransferase